MSINIIKTDKNYNFSDTTLGEPQSLGQSLFFSKIKNINNDIYIQTPEVQSKDGIIIKSRGGYVDIILDNSHEDVLEWIENLESKIKDIIFEEKKDNWFQDSNIDFMDIESVFISPIRSIKSGKQFILRCHIDSPKSMINKKKLMIYDEDENILDTSALDNNKHFIAILHINGLKFSSKNFQVYIDVKEIMVMNEKKELKLNIIKEKKTIKKDDLKIEESLSKNKDIEEKIDSKEKIDCETNNNENQTICIETKNEVNDEISNDKDENIFIEIEEDKTNVEKKYQEDSIDNINNDIKNLKDEVEKITTDNFIEEHKNNIKEFNVMETLDEKNSISINDPTNEQYEIYKKAVEEAKLARQKAMEAYMNAKNIKAKYLFNLEIDSESDEDDLEITTN